MRTFPGFYKGSLNAVGFVYKMPSVYKFAILFIKSNSQQHGHGSKVWNKMYYYFKLCNDEFMKHYHKRSNVETTFFMVKSKFGDMIRSKTKTA